MRSIYTNLRKLAGDGLIRESPQTDGTISESQRVYEITTEGKEFLREGLDMLANADRNWFAMREIFIELMDAALLPTFLREGARENFQLSREIIEAKMPKLNRNEAESALGEYMVNLGNQLRWTKAKLQELKKAKRLRGELT